MPDRLDFDTGSMREGAAALQSRGAEMDGHLQQLVAGAPAWGEDDISQLCQMVYQAIVDVVTEGSGGVSETWNGHGDNLMAAADAYDATEDANADIADRSMEV